MKRTPLQRRTPLKATARPLGRLSRFVQAAKKGARTRKRSKYAKRERQVDYMLWVKTLPCVARDIDPAFPCAGVVEADHAGRRGLGRKCSDVETIAICTEHHRQRGDFAGAFKSWNKDRMRGWLEACVLLTQAWWVEAHGSLPA